MAAQETYRIEEFTKLILREKSDRGQYKDVAAVGDQSARLLDLLYKDAKRGFQYDYIEVKRYDLYLTPADFEFAEDGRFIAEFKRRDDAEKARDALNAAIVTDDMRAARKAADSQMEANGIVQVYGFGQI